MTKVEMALRIVASQVIANAATGYLTPEWENYPDIGEDDWKRIADLVGKIAAELMPSNDMYVTAYDLLSGRAEGDQP